MAETVLMPKAGISVESCLIGSWKKKAGEPVKIGDILFDYETDKATFECESTVDGVLLEIFYEDGDEVPVLTPVCAVGQPGEDTSGLRSGGGPAEPAAQGPGAGGVDAAQTPGAGGGSAPAANQGPGAGGGSAPAANQAPGAGGATAAPAAQAPGAGGMAAAGAGAASAAQAAGSLMASPRAKALAARLGLDIGLASPTGPAGRIIE
ncbi:MAG: E3 binding domain-containing protein, partial [Clostridiales Family XIII bacterium]|nr:E3 binding domain-containing protein [Clostridiales Family XIII bacterium]